jgi:hypothetical protein
MQDAVPLVGALRRRRAVRGIHRRRRGHLPVLGSGATAHGAAGDPRSWRRTAPTTTRTSTSPTTCSTGARAACPRREEREIQRIVLASYRALGCRGWGRADLMIRASDRKPFLLEMNTSPGMTGHSLVPMSARAAGIGYDELCVRLLQAATLDYVVKLVASEAWRMSATLPTPLDIRLMNGDRLGAVRGAWPSLGLAAILWWGLRHPVFSIVAIQVQGDLVHNNVVTLRANVTHRLSGNLFTMDLGGRPKGFRSRAVGAHGGGPPRVPEPAQRPVARAPAGCATGATKANRVLLNNFGEVFRGQPVGDVEADNLPRLSGPAGPVDPAAGHVSPSGCPSSSRWTPCHGTSRTDRPGQLESPARQRYGHRARARNGTAEVIERTRQLRAHGARSATAHLPAARRTAVESADLRHVSGYAMRLRGVTTVTGGRGQGRPQAPPPDQEHTH